MSHVWAGDMDIRMAKDTGRLELKGNPILIRTISSWLRSGTFAPYPATIRPDQHQATSRPNQEIRNPGKEKGIFGEVGRDLCEGMN